DRLQERLRKSKCLGLEEAAKNKGFDLGNEQGAARSSPEGDYGRNREVPSDTTIS
ncbi:hypothetical protein ACJX0J_006508, partial [Zea mays]